MPTFPNYRGELPQCLNPFNPRHYWLLAYWVYFRPTALKCYLYQADPELYRADAYEELGIFRIVQVPAYRNLYLLIPVVSLLLSILVGLFEVLTSSLLLDKPVDWLSWATGMATGVATGVATGMMFGVMFGVMNGVTNGVALGVAFGVKDGAELGAASGLMLGMATGVAFGAAMIGVLMFVGSGLMLGVAAGVATGVGILRVPFFIIQLGWALCSSLPRVKHPLEWDELCVLPMPRTQQFLTKYLQRNELCFVSDLACNPFQRWAAQRALSSHLHKQVSPLHFFYTLLINSNLDAYVFAPVTRQDWKYLPTTRQVLLGELDGRWVDCTSSSWSNLLPELVFYRVTWFFRDRRKTPLTRFAGMLYELLDERTVNAEKFALDSYRNIYARLTNYPGGEEIEQSFEAMASFLSYKEFSKLPAAINIVGARHVVPLPTDDTRAIRPTVITSLHRLRDIAAEVATYIAASSKVNKLAALARATDALKTLDEYVSAQVAAPEQTILHRIIHQWSNLIITEGGIAGRNQEFQPVANPYVVGNPVKDHLFIGREDILRRLEELWMVKEQPPSVVLYGHRRMGKSSILRNLGASLGSQVTVIDFNMQRVGFVANTGELLYNLALALYDGLSPAQQAQIGEPDEDKFLDSNPYTTFDRFLKQLDQVRAEQRFIIAIDEFELIEEAIKKNELEPRLLEFLRSLIQTYSWFVLIFAGLHTLQEMTEDYWNPLFGSVTKIPVSFLSANAARQLITQPSPDFNLDYDQEAIAKIIQLTGAQPYLIQLIGHTLVTRFNRQTYEEGIQRQRRFSLADVEAIIETPEFYRDGNAYFNGVWVQAQMSEPDGQTLILEVLSQGSLSLTEIVEQTALNLSQVQEALSMLENHDVVMLQHGKYVYTVELMRRWVAQRKSKPN